MKLAFQSAVMIAMAAILPQLVLSCVPTHPPLTCSGPTAASAPIPSIVTTAKLREAYEDAVEAWRRAEAARRDCADKLKAAAALAR